jgi:A/G-specific adenine glycosylase
VARKDGLVAILPFKEKKLKVQNRYFNFLLLRYKDELWIERRNEKGIWQNLHQFYLVESPESIDQDSLWQNDFFIVHKLKIKHFAFISQSKQRLTHQLIESKFFEIELSDKKLSLAADGLWIKAAQLNDYAFPKTLVDFINAYV